MFAEVVEERLGWEASRLTGRLAELELARRAIEAEFAATLTAAEAMQAGAEDGHRSTKAFVRAITNQPRADVQVARARFLRDFPDAGDALLAGRVGSAQVDLLARLAQHRRVGRLVTTELVATFLEHAEHFPYPDFKSLVDRWLTLADQDGSLHDVERDWASRNVTVGNVDGGLHVHVVGGDPLAAERVKLIFDRACEAEYQQDLQTRRDRFGDDAEAHPLARTSWQRRYDAFVRIFDTANQHLDAPGRPIDACVNVLVDQTTLQHAFVQAGLMLPNGEVFEPEHLGSRHQREAMIRELCDPERLSEWRCETAAGQAIHPSLVVRALIGGYLRTVIVDSRREIVEISSGRRLFTGAWAVAAHLARPRCEHPGCGVPGHLCQIDHRQPWVAGGPTSQSNSAVLCATHNRLKHANRWRTVRGPDQRLVTIRPDGTMILPAGARPPAGCA